MKVTNEKTENRQTFLSVELEPTEIEEWLGKAYKRMVKKVNIPGFRKGKAPRQILERYVGREELLDEAMREMVPDAYGKAIEQEKLQPVAEPQIDMESLEPFVFKAVVPLQPVTRLGDYQQIRLAEEPVNVTEEQVNELIENIRHEHALWEPVERAAALNDQVIINVQSDIDGTPFVNRLGVQYQLLTGQTFPVAGFAEQLVGTNVGETKEFKLSLPEDYPNKEIAGKEVSFEVVVNEIKEEKLPELNDEFAAQVGEEFKTVDILREKAREELTKQTEDKAKREYEQKIIDEMVKLAEIEYPPVMLEMEIDRLVREQLQRLQIPEDKYGEYLKAVNKTSEQLREEIKPVATKNLVEAIALGEVATQQKIEFSDDEIDAEIEKMVGSVKEENRETMRQYFSTPESRQSIRRLHIGRKTVDKLVEIARGPAVDTEPAGKEEQDEQ